MGPKTKWGGLGLPRPLLATPLKLSISRSALTSRSTLTVISHQQKRKEKENAVFQVGYWEIWTGYASSLDWFHSSINIIAGLGAACANSRSGGGGGGRTGWYSADGLISCVYFLSLLNEYVTPGYECFIWFHLHQRFVSIVTAVGRQRQRARSLCITKRSDFKVIFLQFSLAHKNRSRIIVLAQAAPYSKDNN